MKKRIAALLLTGLMLLLTGCYSTYENSTEPSELIIYTDEATEAAAPETEALTEAPTEALTETPTEALTEAPTEAETETEAKAEPATEPPAVETDYLPEEEETLPASVEKDGSYTTPEDVAEYIHTFGTLPGNFLTKKEAQELGWNSSKGNLWDVAPGMSIGGDKFGNREGLLPKGRYKECDVNYEGGYRGAERLIFSEDGSIYYTNDHYKSFTQLY